MQSPEWLSSLHKNGLWEIECLQPGKRLTWKQRQPDLLFPWLVFAVICLSHRNWSTNQILWLWNCYYLSKTFIVLVRWPYWGFWCVVNTPQGQPGFRYCLIGFGRQICLKTAHMLLLTCHNATMLWNHLGACWKCQGLILTTPQYYLINTSLLLSAQLPWPLMVEIPERMTRMSLYLL